ncbi:MAG: EpsI family protein [Candidatus Eisenbacteria bacterium]|nr:EpsI family protein [Candidatus Eisenbacteria bacterium]
MGTELSFEDAVVEELQADDILIRRYDDGTQPVWLCIVYHQNRRYGAHDPRLCYESQGFVVEREGRATVDDGTLRGMQVNTFLTERQKRKRVVWYWWTTSGLSTSDVGAFRRHMALTGALDNRSWGAFVRVESVAPDGDLNAARARVEDFAARVAKEMPGVFARAAPRRPPRRGPRHAMNVFEQLALGAQCPWRTLRESFRGELWRPWVRAVRRLCRARPAARLRAAPAALVGDGAAGARAAGDGALRYPELFLRLPRVLEWARHRARRRRRAVRDRRQRRCSGRSVSAAHARRGAPAGIARSRWLLLASLPVTLVAVFGHLGLEGLARVRLSGLSRALAPQLLVGAVFVVKAAYFYAVPMVMLDPRGSAALAFCALPRTWAHGLLPALVASGALALLALPLQLLLAKPATLVAVLPEGVLLVAVANAAVRVVQLGLAAGAGTLLYLSALVPGEDEL